MDERENEFENPGGNLPEATREDAIPPDDEPSHVATGVGVIGGEENGDEGFAPSGPDGTQDEPRMDHDDVGDLDKVAGIVVQTRADVGTESESRIAEVLAQRLSDAGVELPDEEIADLARQIATGESNGSE